MTHVTIVDAERVAVLAKALAHPARVQIVELLAEQSTCRGSEVFSELPLAQSTISEHLRVLKDAGVVQASREGTAMTYCLRYGALDELSAAVAALAGTAACGPEGCGQ